MGKADATTEKEEKRILKAVFILSQNEPQLRRVLLKAWVPTLDEEES